MKGKVLVFGLLALFAAACGNASAGHQPPQTHAPEVCRDAKVKDTLWNKSEQRCRGHLDSCLKGLAPAQRASWEDQMDSCLKSQSVYDCYAKAPWC